MVSKKGIKIHKADFKSDAVEKLLSTTKNSRILLNKPRRNQIFLEGPVGPDEFRFEVKKSLVNRLSSSRIDIDLLNSEKILKAQVGDDEIVFKKSEKRRKSKRTTVKRDLK